MPTSVLYDNTRAQLAARLPRALDSQLDTLAHLLVGVVQSASCSLSKIARSLPLDTSQEGKEQRIDRFLLNPRISAADHFQPLAKGALASLRGQRVSLLLDRVLFSNGQNVLLVSAAFRRRSVPLAWLVLSHRGSSTLQDQQSVLSTAWDLLPERVRVTVHADSEFRSQKLASWILEKGGNYMLGTRGDTLLSWSECEQGTALATHVPDDAVVYFEQVYLTEEKAGPHTVIAWWQTNPEGKRQLYAVMTNLSATYQTYLFGRRRMWIETVFRDWQSYGFALDASRVLEPGRFERLILLLAAAYLLLLCVGRYVVKKGWRRKIDSGPSRAWQYSLFQLALGWRDHLGAFGRAIPVIFTLYC